MTKSRPKNNEYSAACGLIGFSAPEWTEEESALFECLENTLVKYSAIGRLLDRDEVCVLAGHIYNTLYPKRSYTDGLKACNAVINKMDEVMTLVQTSYEGRG